MSTFDEVHAARLTRLADHLESGKLGHRFFDFSVYSDTQADCGTAGCALGECPYVFPDDWEFDLKTGDGLRFPYLKGQSDWTAALSAEVWFGVTQEEGDHLFNPGEQKPRRYGGVRLGDGATRYQVAANIRAFLERKRIAEIEDMEAEDLLV